MYPRPRVNAIAPPVPASNSSSTASLLMMMDPHQFSKDSYPSSQQPSFGSSAVDLVDMDMDMLLANVGYHVRASDLAHVAQRLEQLESALSAAQEASISHLASEAVHYNPSDLAGWIECMLGELSPNLLEVPDHPPAISTSHDGAQLGAALIGSSPPLLGCSSQVETSRSYADNSPAQQQQQQQQQPSSGGSISSNVSELAHDAVALEGPPRDSMDVYPIPNYSPMALLQDLGDYQYKALVVDDQTSSTTQHSMESFYPGIQVGAALPPPVRDPPPQIPLFSGSSHMHLAPIAPPSVPANVPRTLQHQRRPFPQQILELQPSHRQDGLIGSIASSPRSSKTRASPSRQEQAPQPKRQRSDHQELQHRGAPARAPSALSTNSPAAAFSQHQQKPQIIPGISGVHDQQSIVSAEDEDAQESGIRLVHLLMACAKAVHNDEYAASVEMVGEIKRLASVPGNGTMGKVANKFVEALKARIFGVSMEDWKAQNQKEAALSELLYHSFYETCPYLKFAHFTANQAILEAFQGHKFVHVIDFNLMQGLQWPALIQALAFRPGGPPHLRLTGIGPVQPDNALHDVGLWLGQIAKSFNVQFAFMVAPRLDDVKPWLLEVQQGEAIAINSIFQLHGLLYQDSPSAISSIDRVLQSVRSLNPKVVTVVEQEANHNSPVFIDRFVQALHYYSTMFDSLEECGLPPECPQLLYSEMYLGREIINVVACEGASRTERHEMLSRWRSRFSDAGFIPLHLGSNAYKQASMLLEYFSGEGYTVEENAGCLTLGWHSRPLIASSAWQCG